LGGTATALLIAGTLGKTIIEHWFKKDFKRYEAKLDALASRDETKFNSLHTERVSAVKDIYPKCQEIVNLIGRITHVKKTVEDLLSHSNDKILSNLEGEVLTIADDLTAYVLNRSYLFNNGEARLILAFLDCSYELIMLPKADGLSDTGIQQIISKVHQSLQMFFEKHQAVEFAFKAILGSDKL